MGNYLKRLLSRHAGHWLFRYGLAVLLFGLTLGLSTLLSRSGIRINLTVPVILSIVAAAWYGGRGPGLLVSVLFQATTMILTPVPPEQSALYRWSLHASVFALYVFLTFLISGLRIAQQRLRQHRDLLQITLTSIGDGVVTTDKAGVVTFMNPVAQRLTGWDDSAVGRNLDDVIPIIDEGTREKVESPVEKVLASGTVVGLANHSLMIARDGREIPIEDSAAPIVHEGEVRGVVMVFSDVSARKQAERARRENELMQGVIFAQESERRRIARDLHDHLGQRMTAMRLRVEAVARECGKYEEIANALTEIQKAASEIDRDVAFLSWELRPTELENLGLDDAVESYVKEWSRQYNITVDFHTTATNGSSMLARLPRDTETNIYRIVQESLNNVLKHADATKISVLMQYRKNDLTVIVEDDGIGFLSDTNLSSGAAPGGFGLTGMRERAELVGGTLKIESEPGAGTTVIARIPVRSEMRSAMAV